MTQQSARSEPTSDDKLWAALGYPIPIIALIMLLVEDKKTRPFIKFHSVQALAVFVVFIAAEILVSVLNGILSAMHIGFVGLIFGCITPFLWLLLLWPAYLAFQGKYFAIPVITKILRDQHWVA
jgi:uncharacterized membrane protein